MIEIIKQRHSVRQYEDRKIDEERRATLNDLVAKINKESGLNFQICFDEPEAFDTFLAHYGKFQGVQNYVVLVGEKGKDEQVGYFGEQVVLKAQEIGLNTCWVALTYGKSKTKIQKKKGEKIYCTLALGFGKNQGVPHKSKTKEQISNVSSETPKWFEEGVEASLLAPTAMNQQKFKFVFEDGKVKASAGIGFYAKVDLGIAKYHFELGAKQKVEWI